MLHIAVLGSTRGTDLQVILDAINEKRLDASVAVVISDRPDAYILTRAKDHGISAYFLDPKQKIRETFDQEIMDTLSRHSIDVVLLIGYMRILSNPFVNQYKGRIINVHPSLLPAFAGGMDINVHEKVLQSGVKETGCTVHLVDEGVDTGQILLQKKCAVLSDDTPDSLKKRVQKLEGEALIEILQSWNITHKT